MVVAMLAHLDQTHRLTPGEHVNCTDRLTPGENVQPAYSWGECTDRLTPGEHIQTGLLLGIMYRQTYSWGACTDRLKPNDIAVGWKSPGPVGLKNSQNPKFCQTPKHQKNCF